MVYLNGHYIPLEKATISVMDRGFLFSDGVYEVVPVYQGRPFRFDSHLSRLQYSLDALSIKNPYAKDTWLEIITTLIKTHIEANNNDTLSIYIQITKGCADSREHIEQTALMPTIFAQAKTLKQPSFQDLSKPHYAVTATDIRWHRCDIKSIALLGNILLLQQAKQNDAEEVILIRDNQITEGASSNVFMVKNNAVFTHPENSHILSGITRSVVIESVRLENIALHEIHFSLEDLIMADEIWISSSTKEITPITHLNGQAINGGKYGKIWHKVYQRFQSIKTAELILNQ